MTLFFLFASVAFAEECGSSNDCQHGWMCNFDYQNSGFCENCDAFRSREACIGTGFITNRGTDECFTTCLNEENHEVHSSTSSRHGSNRYHGPNYDRVQEINPYRYHGPHYRTTSRPHRDMCQDAAQEFGFAIPIFGAIETAGLVDYLFDDSYEDFSIVDLYKFVRDDVKNEYQLYETAKKEAESETDTDNSFELLMSDTTKRTHGTIQSDHPYENSFSKRWNVETDCQNILLKSTKFQTESSYDTVRVNDGYSTSGTTSISEIIDGPNFSVYFSSDSSVNKYGFDLTWECTEAETVDPVGPIFATKCAERLMPGFQSLMDSREQLPEAVKAVALEISSNLGGPMEIRDRIIMAVYDLFTFITSDDGRLGMVSKFIFGARPDDDAQEYLNQAKSFLSQTPSELLTATGMEVDDLAEQYRESVEEMCSSEYDVFEGLNFVLELSKNSDIWSSDDLTSQGPRWLEIRAVRDLLNNPIMELSGQDVSVGDIYNAFNDAIETVGDFGSYKKIARSVLVLAKHSLNKLSNPPCFFTEELMITLGPEPEGPTEALERFKSDIMRNTVVSFFTSDVVFGTRHARDGLLEIATDIKTIVKAIGLIAENLGIDLNASLEDSPTEEEISINDIKKFVLDSTDLFVNYAYCGNENFCEALNNAITDK